MPRNLWFTVLLVVSSSLAARAQDAKPAAAPESPKRVGHWDGPPIKPEEWWPTQPRALPLVHPLFSDDMVLQREIAAPIWGWSTPGDKISVAWNGKDVGEPVTAGADGKWTTKIGPFPPGGPHTLTVQGKLQAATFTNVLVGDVWLCSGQSNMNWPVRLSDNAEEEVQNANYPQIRSFTCNFYPALFPQDLPQATKWETCTPEFAKNFSGVGYFFARDVHKATNVPIGIIHSSVGATYAEVWVSAEALARDMPHDFNEELAVVKQAADATGSDYFGNIEQWLAAADPQSAKLKYATAADLDASDWRDVEVPQAWEETGLKDFDGLVWYRREVEVPSDWGKIDLQLSLSMVRDVDVVWFNGTLVGATQISGKRRFYRIPAAAVRPGKNVLVAAVLNREKAGGFVGEAKYLTLTPAEAAQDRKVSVAGKWKMKPGPALRDIAQPFPQPPVRHYKTLAAMYNGMIAPLVPFGIKGALWYQGEANGPRWLMYRRLLPTLIADWRARFGVGDFPFLIVSLANYNPAQKEPVEVGWAEIRESQWRTARKVPNTGLAMTIDIGDPKDIHPRNKQEVGRRLSLVARKLVYGEKDLVASGPEFEEMQVELPRGETIRLYFKNLGGGLIIKPGDEKLTGFAIAGDDKVFKWADARIDGDQVVVSSPEVPAPKYVRYGWAWNPRVNLYNKAGLPAITFRTDE